MIPEGARATPKRVPSLFLLQDGKTRESTQESTLPVCLPSYDRDAQQREKLWVECRVRDRTYHSLGLHSHLSLNFLVAISGIRPKDSVGKDHVYFILSSLANPCCWISESLF